MAKQPKPKKDEKPQSERFKDMARQVEADESGEAFERAFRKIVEPKLPEKRSRP